MSKELLDELKSLTAEVKSLKSENDEIKKALKAPVYPGGNNPLIPAVAADAKAEGRMGYKNFNHFALDTVQCGRISQNDWSLVMKSWTASPIYKAATALNETVGSEGGFLIPPTFANELLMRTYDNKLLEKLDMRQTTGNTLSVPAIDETSRVDGSRFGGVRMYWDAEAAQMTTTKPAYMKVELRLHKLMGISYATDELLQDSGIAIEQHLYKVFGMEMAFKIGDAIINGTGAGMPLGLLNSSATVSITKETGQAAATILYENINKMYSRLYAPCRPKAMWLINQDVEPQLETMVINQGGIAYPVYLPPGGASERPYATLKGLPVMPVEFCASLGTVGDIILVDLSQVLGLRKNEAEQASSIHLRFDYAETAFRLIFRADARPWWVAPLTPYKGSATQSFAITLSRA